MKELLIEELQLVNGGMTVTRGGVKYEVNISEENKQLHKEVVVATTAAVVGTALSGGLGYVGVVAGGIVGWAASKM